MPYLICERCNGHYELKKGESIEDFSSCSCGGDLRYVEDLDDNKSSKNSMDHEFLSNYNDENSTSNGLKDGKRPIDIKKLILLVSIFLFISVAASSLIKYVPASNNNSNNATSTIGHNVQGYVDKYTYGSSSGNTEKNRKIAIVTGIHPREPLSKNVMTDLLKKYNVPPGWTVVQYDINVVKNPDDFSIGRTNGETLAATYILSDIVKSKYELVIICHDHEYGYGEGFYFATPKMDQNSVIFADQLKNDLPNFNYYKNNGNTEPGSSNIHFTDPLVSNGYKAIVYEIPGYTSYAEAYNMNKELLDTVFNIL